MRTLPNASLKVMSSPLVDAYISSQYNWNIQEAKRFEARLRQKFPELDATVIRALGNRWHFGWSR